MACYTADRRHGDPSIRKRIRAKGTADERFVALVDRRGPDDCWPWQGKLHHGYGRLVVDYKPVPAHRLAYERVYGPAPDGLVIDHTCHNDSTGCPGGDACVHRACCNPAHLRATSIGDNVKAGLSRAR